MKFACRLVLAACCLGMAVSARAAEPVPLRVLSWNIHHGEDASGQIVIDKIAAYIREQKPDVVLLQEVDQQCERSGNIDEAKKIAEVTGLQASFGAAFDFQGGQYGQAILSRFPISDLQIHRLPSTDEPRVLVRAQIQTPHGPWIVASAHLDAANARRRHVQAQMVAEILQQSPLPVVLGGDFNAIPNESTMKVFTQAPWSLGVKAGKPATEPAPAPINEIDHLILRGLNFNQAVAVLPEAKLSDHRPILAEVAPPN